MHKQVCVETHSDNQTCSCVYVSLREWEFNIWIKPINELWLPSDRDNLFLD